jgi:hypothetical protein
MSLSVCFVVWMFDCLCLAHISSLTPTYIIAKKVHEPVYNGKQVGGCFTANSNNLKAISIQTLFLTF